MLAILAIILLIIWGVSLAFDVLGVFVHLFLAAGVLFLIAHFFRGRGSRPTATP